MHCATSPLAKPCNVLSLVKGFSRGLVGGFPARLKVSAVDTFIDKPSAALTLSCITAFVLLAETTENTTKH